MSKVFGEGSMAPTIAEDADWPPAKPVQFDIPNVFPLCTVQAVAQPNGTIIVTIRNHEGGQYELTSPRIERSGTTPIKFAFRWNEINASLAVSGKIVDRTDGKADFDEATLVVTEKQWTPDKSLQAELRELAAKNHTERTEYERAKKPKDGHRLRSLQENLLSLAERTEALSDLLKLIHVGKIHHLSSVSAHLRLLVCHAKKNAHPLLQRVAGLIDEPLIIFGLPPNAHEKAVANGYLPDIADFSLVSAEPTRGCYEMDIDGWLKQTGIVYYGAERSNNDFIKLFADSDGAHHDPSLTPEFDFWSELLVSGSAHRNQILVRTSVIVIGLSKTLLEKAKEYP